MIFSVVPHLSSSNLKFDYFIVWRNQYQSFNVFGLFATQSSPRIQSAWLHFLFECDHIPPFHYFSGSSNMTQTDEITKN